MLQQLSPKMRVNEAANLTHLHPTLAYAFARTKQEYIRRYPSGNRPYLLYSFRDNALQAKLYAQGRTAPGPIVTYKKAGTSKHNRNPAEAFDVAFVTDSYELDYSTQQYRDFYEILSEIAPEIVWGGLWSGLKDYPHFELRG